MGVRSLEWLKRSLFDTRQILVKLDLGLALAFLTMDGWMDGGPGFHKSGVTERTDWDMLQKEKAPGELPVWWEKETRVEVLTAAGATRG